MNVSEYKIGLTVQSTESQFLSIQESIKRQYEAKYHSKTSSTLPFPCVLVNSNTHLDRMHLQLLHLLPLLALTYAIPFTNVTSTTNSTKPAYLKGNQECGSNNQCSMTCKDGDFHPMSSNGTIYFACTMQADHEIKYSIWDCKDTVLKDNIEVCEAASGRWCSSKGYCILPDKGDGFGDLCKEKGAEARMIKDDLEYGAVLSEENCKG